MKRVVTGHRDGKSVIIDEREIIPRENPLFTGELAFIWQPTEVIPTIPVDESESTKELSGKLPEPGQVYLGYSWLYPDKEVYKKAEEKGIDIEDTWKKVIGDDFMMHTTDTIDYDIIISGELWLEMDDEVEVHLTPGDCVIQNGTRHAWRNRGSEPCFMVTVMTGAKRT